MFFKVISGAVLGAEPYLVSVEADVTNGMPVFHMVGLLSSEVKEARERVRSALKNSGYSLPPQRITVNLSPADRRKEGSSFDLPVAVAVLRAAKLIPEKRLQRTLVIGELGLDGRVKGVSAVLPVLLEAKRQGITCCIIPAQNIREARSVRGIEIIAVENLGQTVTYIIEGICPTVEKDDEESSEEKAEYPDFSEVQGHLFAKRAAEISAAGHHNLLMIGPPGSGKSMLAERIAGILPPMTAQEQLEVSSIYSISGLLKDKPCMKERPFRSPHHTITIQAMAGGGQYPKPGEVSLAHKGVLFLDEIAEYSAPVLETLREPLENHTITITRNTGNYVFAADCMLVAAMNPCKCGYYPDRSRCKCTDEEVYRYQRKISGAVLDRIDVCAEIPPVAFEELQSLEAGESSAAMRERIEEAAKRQEYRYRGLSITRNSALSSAQTGSYCKVSAGSRRLLEESYQKWNLTTRGYYKILKVARTIADLELCEEIEEQHIAEALVYRTANQKYF